jgi:hypothetical protein
VSALALGSFSAQPLLAATAASAWSNHGYQVWRESHREEAVDAERWLESQLTRHAKVLERFHRFEHEHEHEHEREREREHERDGMRSRPELVAAY